MRNQLRTIVLLGALSALVVGVGGAFAPDQLWGFALMAGLMNLGAYFFSDKIVLALHRARQVTAAEAPTLHRIVDELAARARLPKPRVYIIPAAQPNAFATGRNPQHAAVAVTEGIIDLLDERELRGVLAHEIAHVGNRDILVSSLAAAMASLVTYLSHAFAFFGGRRSDDEGSAGSGAAGLGLIIVAPLAATLIQLGISRSREYLADETGARLCGDPEALASALVRLEQAAHVVPAAAAPGTASLFIVNPFAGAGSLLRLFSTHPPIAERVRRLRALRV